MWGKYRKTQRNAESRKWLKMGEYGREKAGKFGENSGKCGKRKNMARKRQVCGKSRKRMEKGRTSFLYWDVFPVALILAFKKISLADFFKIFMQEIIFVFKNFKCHIFIRYEAPAESMINNLCKCFPMGDSSVLQMHILIYICFSVIKIIFTFAEIQFHPLPSFWSLNSKY